MLPEAMVADTELGGGSVQPDGAGMVSLSTEICADYTLGHQNVSSVMWGAGKEHISSYITLTYIGLPNLDITSYSAQPFPNLMYSSLCSITGFYHYPRTYPC